MGYVHTATTLKVNSRKDQDVIGILEIGTIARLGMTRTDPETERLQEQTGNRLDAEEIFALLLHHLPEQTMEKLTELFHEGWR